MKKMVAQLLVILLAGVLAACSASQEDAAQIHVIEQNEANSEGFFSGEVLEINEESFLLRITDRGNCTLTLDTEALVPKEVLSTDGCPELIVGRPVRVVFDGEILETDPIQLKSVFAIYQMDNEGHCMTKDGIVDFGILPYGMEISAEAVTPTGLTLVCTRSDEGGEELWTNDVFRIERYQEATNGWEELSRSDDWNGPLVWHDVAYWVPAQDTVKWELNWQAFYGQLPAGQYRVVKTIYNMENQETVCYTGFSIPNETT